MILLFDIGNTHTHVGLANERRVLRQKDAPTARWFDGGAAAQVVAWAGRHKIAGICLCSVVPAATARVRSFAALAYGLRPLELGPKTVRGLGIDYPRPETIGPDRLANAVAAFRQFGAPVVVVDFGTAVTFDVVDARGHYVGGIIAPGLSAMTDYLHEKTALLPRIEIRDIRGAVGKSTQEAMLIGAVHGYRGLIHELVGRLKSELGAENLPVVFTGGYAKLMARGLPEVRAVNPRLTLEGLLWVWRAHRAGRGEEVRHRKERTLNERGS